MRLRMTLSQIMGVIALVGVLLGLVTRYPQVGISILVLMVMPFAVVAVPCCTIFGLSRLRLRYRLPIELAILMALLGCSTLIW